MLKVTVTSLKPGMKLAKPIVNEAGMILLGEGTAITNSLIERLQSMELGSVYVEGSARPDKPIEEMLAQLDERFSKSGSNPAMGMLKNLFREHIEGLYK